MASKTNLKWGPGLKKKLDKKKRSLVTVLHNFASWIKPSNIEDFCLTCGKEPNKSINTPIAIRSIRHYFCFCNPKENYKYKEQGLNHRDLCGRIYLKELRRKWVLWRKNSPPFTMLIFPFNTWGKLLTTHRYILSVYCYYAWNWCIH